MHGIEKVNDRSESYEGFVPLVPDLFRGDFEHRRFWSSLHTLRWGFNYRIRMSA